MGVAVVLAGAAALVGLSRIESHPRLSAVEQQLVGQWQTEHGHVDTTIELRADRTVSVTQEIRLALPGERTCRVGPVLTTGRWRVDGGRLLLETSSTELATPSWQKVRRFVHTQRWPGDGALHRDWGLRFVARDRFDFIDHGSGERGCALKCVVATTPAPTTPVAELILAQR